MPSTANPPPWYRAGLDPAWSCARINNLALRKCHGYHDTASITHESCPVKISFRRWLCISAGLLLTCNAVQAASSLDLGLSNESVRVRYGKDVNTSPQGRKEVGIGALFKNNDNVMLDA